MRLPLVAAVLACSCAGPRAADARLVVASDLDNLPFAGVDGGGRPFGRDVEMMEELGAELGRRVEWKRMPFEALLPAVEAGEVDIVCATLGVTPERAEHVEFTRPYFRTSIAVVVRSGADNPTGIDELAGRRVAAGRGTTSERAVRRHAPEAILALEDAKGLSSAERLLAGDVDAAVMDGPAADALVTAYPGKLTRLADDLDVEHYALALPKGRTRLLVRLDEALARMESSGRLLELDSRHLGANRR